MVHGSGLDLFTLNKQGCNDRNIPADFNLLGSKQPAGLYLW